jgi:L-ascorbate metabolism protein UlaG (beta-lactamase superfamily)
MVWRYYAADNIVFPFKDDAIRAAEMVRCENVLGVHYDTFPPTKIDHEQTLCKFKVAGKRLRLPPISASHKF